MNIIKSTYKLSLSDGFIFKAIFKMEFNEKHLEKYTIIELSSDAPFLKKDLNSYDLCCLSCNDSQICKVFQIILS